MPRAKVKFSTTNPPNDPEWPRNPELAMQNIANKNNAAYIKGSLAMATGGKHAEALFETVEPEPGSKATRLHQLGVDLDASTVCLYIDPRWWAELYPDLAGPQSDG
ncbi:MAG: hypothetical protein ACJ738_15185 [Gaiellales bacterium]|jgi:hypothetical protein